MLRSQMWSDIVWYCWWHVYDFRHWHVCSGNSKIDMRHLWGAPQEECCPSLTWRAASNTLQCSVPCGAGAPAWADFPVAVMDHQTGLAQFESEEDSDRLKRCSHSQKSQILSAIFLANLAGPHELAPVDLLYQNHSRMFMMYCIKKGRSHEDFSQACTILHLQTASWQQGGLKLCLSLALHIDRRSWLKTWCIHTYPHHVSISANESLALIFIIPAQKAMGQTSSSIWIMNHPYHPTVPIVLLTWSGREAMWASIGTKSETSADFPTEFVPTGLVHHSEAMQCMIRNTSKLCKTL